MCFRFLMFSLSVPCELLCLPCFIASCTGVVVSAKLYPYIICKDLSMDLVVLCVECLKVFAN